jgi:UDP-2,4-diacetamido-2,4,6-trideoxy-beta-L-altropyranose hydrolase
MLRLRKATSSDAELLYQCNNDPSTRAASRSTKPITPYEHQRWLSARLNDPGCTLYLIELEGASVGNIRLQRSEANAAELSIALLPEARAKNIGAEAIRLVCQRLPEGITQVDAWIWEKNTASLRCFARCGFSQVRQLHLDDKLFFVYQHRPTPQPSEHPAES